MSNEQEANQRATDTALDKLLKAAKAVARHDAAHRQCSPNEHREILMRVGELFELSNAVAAMEAAPASVGEVEFGLTEIALNIQNWLDYQKADRAREGLSTDDTTALIAPPRWPVRGALLLWVKTMNDAAAALRHPQAPWSGEVVGWRWRYLYKNRGPELTDWHVGLYRLDPGSQYRDYQEFEEQPLYASPSQPPIPAGVHYSAENDNFYGMWSGIGCGQAFYDDWYGRRAEFPDSRARRPEPSK